MDGEPAGRQADSHASLRLLAEGAQYARAGRLAEAEAKFRAAVAADPDNFEALNNLGALLLQKGQPQEALRPLNQALARRPKTPEVHNNLVLAYRMLGRPDQAISHLEEFVSLRPEHAPALGQLVAMLFAEMRAPDAVAVLERIVARHPEQAFVHHTLANALRTVGRLDDARHAVEAAIALEPANGHHHYLLADLKRFAPEDLPAMESAARRSQRSDERAALLFALAKGYDDTGAHERAFVLLREANRIMRLSVPYVETAALGHLEYVRKTFTPELMRAMAGRGDPSRLPVFILGMPRSGTTLVEQVLASHPKVAGAGENDVLPNLVRTHVPAFPAGVAKLTDQRLHEIARGYLLGMGRLLGGAERVTDKTLDNAPFAGLALLAFPNARFIRVLRDPVDTCLSCYSRRFVQGLEYTNDLGELGRYCRAHAALLDHWDEVFPAGTMLSVRYEELVADLEGQARRLLAHCGLDWDDACLAFDRNKRPVFTASAAQVRKPIYRTSVGRWRPPPDALRPLLDGLGLSA